MTAHPRPWSSHQHQYKIQGRLFPLPVADRPVPVGQSPCQDTDVDFFSDDPEEQAIAVTLCSACPFWTECSEQRGDSEYGVWAGVVHSGITGPEALRREIRELREQDPEITSYRIEKTLGVGRSSVQWALRMIEKEDAA